LEKYGTVSAMARGEHLGDNSLRYWLKRHGVEYDSSPVRGDLRGNIRVASRLLKQIGGWPDKRYVAWPSLAAARERLWEKHRKVRKVLVLADLHVPHQWAELIAAALRRDGDADLGVFLGDLFDCAAFSRFRDKPSYPFAEEWKTTKKVVAILLEAMPWVFVRANHESRIEKLIRLIEPELADFLSAEGADIIGLLGAGVKSQGGDADRLDGIGDWWIKIGDAVLAHKEEFRSATMQSVDWVADFFRNQWGGLGVGSAPQVIVQAHTHYQLRKPYQQFHTVLETGCLCHDMDWFWQTRTAGARRERWRRGYAVLHFDKQGRSDPNGCHYVSLG
jgi:hypothetical protein